MSLTHIHFHHYNQIYSQLPMKAQTILPDEGVTPLLLEIASNGMLAWVHVKPKPAPGIRWGHRVIVTCPTCKREIPFGRMNQHWPMHGEQFR